VNPTPFNPFGNPILDPLGVTPPILWQPQTQQPPAPLAPSAPAAGRGFEWNFLYTEAILAFAFVAVVGYLCRERDTSRGR
jgi:hypothetical protein